MSTDVPSDAQLVGDFLFIYQKDLHTLDGADQARAELALEQNLSLAFGVADWWKQKQPTFSLGFQGPRKSLIIPYMTKTITQMFLKYPRYNKNQIVYTTSERAKDMLAKDYQDMLVPLDCQFGGVGSLDGKCQTVTVYKGKYTHQCKFVVLDERTAGSLSDIVYIDNIEHTREDHIDAVEQAMQGLFVAVQ